VLDFDSRKTLLLATGRASKWKMTVLFQNKINESLSVIYQVPHTCMSSATVPSQESDGKEIDGTTVPKKTWTQLTTNGMTITMTMPDK